MKQFDVLILGAGASGLWCAKTAAQRGLSVCVIDHARKAGKKIRIAGGGKGNFTNLDVSHTNYICGNPHFTKSALARFSPWEMVEYLSIHGIAWEEREHNQLFCLRSANDIVTALTEDCKQAGVTFFFGHTIQTVAAKQQAQDTQENTVETDQGSFSAPALVLALGGPAWPQSGATDLGYRLAKQLGHAIRPPKPALVPFTMPGNWLLHGLQGIALPATITCNKKHFTENVLFTHKGISGPAVLQISNYWQKGDALHIDFLPAKSTHDVIASAEGRALVRNIFSRYIPERLATILLGKTGEKQIAQLSKQDCQRIANQVHDFTCTPKGTEGFAKAEVTGGGVDTTHVSSKTMESTQTKGVYIIGEMLDVTGHLGGFNLHWAWASGHAAGMAIPTTQ